MNGMRAVFAAIIYAAFTALVADPGLSNDSYAYYHYANNLIETGVYGISPGVPDSVREPGYSLFLVPILFLFGKNLAAIVFFQSLLWFLGITFLVKTLNTDSKIQNHHKIFWAFCIFSPSLWSASGTLYSEWLSALLVLSFVVLAIRFTARDANYAALGFGGLAWTFAVLTKAYLVAASFGFLLVGVALVMLKKSRKMGLYLLFSGTLALAVWKGWSIRSQTLVGQDTGRSRLMIAVVGRAARLERVEYPKDLGVAFVSILGSNFCERLYSKDRCVLFDFRGADLYGPPIIREFSKEYGSLDNASSALLNLTFTMLAKDFVRTITGYLHEVARMSMFESAPKLDKGPVWIQKLFNSLSSLWHLLGSILLIAFTIRGMQKVNWRNEVSLISVGLIAYHYLIMMNFSNVIRYGFTILPLIYWFASRGASPEHRDGALRRITK